MPLVNPTKSEIINMFEEAFGSEIRWPTTDIGLIQLYRNMHLLRLKKQQGGRLEGEQLRRSVNDIFGISMVEVNSKFWALYFLLIGFNLEKYLYIVTPFSIGDDAEARSVTRDLPPIPATKTLLEAQRSAGDCKYCQLDMQSRLPQLYNEEQSAVSNLLHRYKHPEQRIKIVNLCYRMKEGKKLSDRDASTARKYLPIANLDPLQLSGHLLVSPSKHDAAVERSAFFRSVLLSIDITSKQHIVIVNPSPLFIMKWIKTEWLREYPVTFVLDDPSLCKLLKKSEHLNNREVEFLDAERLHAKRWKSNRLQKASVIAFSYAHKPYSELTLSSLLQPYVEKNLLLDGCRILGVFGRKPKQAASTAQGMGTINRLTLHSVWFLPSRIAYSTAFPKIVLQASFTTGKPSHNPEDVEVICLRRGTSEDKLCLTQSLSTRFLGKVSWAWLGFAYHQLIRTSRAASGIAKERRAAVVLPELGPNLRFSLSTSERINAKTLYTVRSYLPPSTTKIARGGLNKGAYINNTEKKMLRQTSSSPIDIIKEYVDQKVKCADGLVSIRTLIAKAFHQPVFNFSYTLREYWFLHPSIEENIETNLIPLLKKFMYSDAADTLLSSASAEVIEDTIDELFAESTGIAAKEGILSAVIQYFEHALQSNCLESHPFQHLDDEGLPAIRNVFAEIRNALRPHSLTCAQRGGLQELLRQHKDDIRYLAMWLQLETGADYREICALCWECLVFDTFSKAYNIIIDRQLNANGEQVEQARSKRSHEISNELAHALIAFKSEIRNWSPPQERLQESRRLCERAHASSSPG